MTRLILIASAWVFICCGANCAQAHDLQFLREAVGKLDETERFRLPAGYTCHFESTTTKSKEKTVIRGVMTNRDNRFLMIIVRDYGRNGSADIALNTDEGFCRLTRDFRKHEKVPKVEDIASARPFTVGGFDPGRRWEPSVGDFAIGFAAIPGSGRSIPELFRSWEAGGAKFEVTQNGNQYAFELRDWPADYIEDRLLRLKIDENATVREIAYTLKGGTKSQFKLIRTSVFEGKELPTEIMSSADLTKDKKRYYSQTKSVANFTDVKFDIPDEAFKLTYWAGEKIIEEAPVAQAPSGNWWWLVSCGILAGIVVAVVAGRRLLSR